MVFKQVFLFELKARLVSKATWIAFTVLVLLAFRDVMSTYWDELVGTGQVYRNSAFGAYYFMMFSSFWAAIFGVGFATSPLLKDLTTKSAPILYASPINDQAYFWGKYFAALLGMIIVMLGTPTGFALVEFVGPMFLSEDQPQVGSTPWLSLLHAYAVWTLTAIIIFTSLHFAIASMTGKLFGSYLVVVTLMLLWMISEIYLRNSSSMGWVQVIDPVGMSTVDGQVLYWTIEQRNTGFMQFWDSALMYNRFLYIGAALMVLFYAAWRFDLRGLLMKVRKAPSKKSVQTSETKTQETVELPSQGLSPVGIHLSWLSQAKMVWSQGVHEWKLVVKDRYFLIILFFLGIFGFSVTTGVGQMFQPEKGHLSAEALIRIDQVVEVFFLNSLLISVFYIGEIMHRDATAKTTQIIQATPVSTAALFMTKMVGVVLLLLMLAIVPEAVIIIHQLFAGVSPIEWRLFGELYLLKISQFLIAFGVTTVLAHVIGGSKLIGNILALFVIISILVFFEFGTIQHPMLWFGLPAPGVGFSVFNTYAAQYDMLFMMFGYFMGLSALFVTLAYFIWQRGTEYHLLGTMRSRARPGALAVVGSAVVVFGLSGYYGYQNINVINDYQTREEQVAERALYEQIYRPLANKPQPTLLHSDMALDVSLADRKMVLNAQWDLRNETSEPVDMVWLQLPEDSKSFEMKGLQGHSLTLDKADADLRQMLYRVEPALAPGDTIQAEMALTVQYIGFDEDGRVGGLYPQASHIKLEDILPKMGYQTDREEDLLGNRLLHKLGESTQLTALKDAEQETTPYLESHAPLATWKMAVTLDEPQRVVMPGHTFQQTGRVWQAESNQAMPLDWQMAIADYNLSEDVWQGAEQSVAIEVLSHPTHSNNHSVFLTAAKDALAHFTKRYGQYGFDRLLIAEGSNHFSDIHTAGNMIVIPEYDGWVHDYAGDDPGVDWVRYVIGRELAKHWWQQQFNPADAEGALVLTDGLPMYEGLNLLVHKAYTQNPNDKNWDEVQFVLTNLEDHYQREQALDASSHPSLLTTQDQDYMAKKTAFGLLGLSQLMGMDFQRVMSQFQQGRLSNGGLPNVGQLYQALLQNAQSPAQEQLMHELFEQEARHQIRLETVKVMDKGEAETQLAIAFNSKRVFLNEKRERLTSNQPRLVDVIAILEDGQHHPIQVVEAKEGINELKLAVPSKTQAIMVGRIQFELDDNRSNNRKALP